MEHFNVTYMTCKTLQTVYACVWYSGSLRNHRNFEKLETWGRGQDESFDTLSTLVPVKTSANGLRISQETRRKCISLGVSRNSGEKTRWSDRISCSLAKKVRWESRRCEEGSINNPIFISDLLAPWLFSSLVNLAVYSTPSLVLLYRKTWLCRLKLLLVKYENWKLKFMWLSACCRFKATNAKHLFSG